MQVFKYIFDARDNVDIGSFHRIEIEPIVFKTRLNLLSLSFFCLVVLCLSEPKAASP